MKPKTARIAPYPIRYADRTAADMEAIEMAFRLDTLAGESEVVAEYERALCEYFGVEHAITVNSGSSAIHCSLVAAGVVPGSEVLISAAAPLPSILPILTVGAVPVFVDTASSTLDFDIDDLERKITPETRAALVVHLWGYPIDVADCTTLLHRHGIPLIEDACQAHGSKIGGQYAGTLGLMGCFSTHEYKCISTGEGGFVLTNDAHRAGTVRQLGRLGLLDGKHHGFNFKLGGIAASLGLCRLRRLNQRLATHSENAQLILASVKSSRVKEMPIPSNAIPNYYSLVVCLNMPKEQRTRALEDLVKNGILGDHLAFSYDVAYRRPMFQHHPHDCLKAEALVDRVIQIPCHPGISTADAIEIGGLLTDIACCYRGTGSGPSAL